MFIYLERRSLTRRSNIDRRYVIQTQIHRYVHVGILLEAGDSSLEEGVVGIEFDGGFWREIGLRNVEIEVAIEIHSPDASSDEVVGKGEGEGSWGRGKG